MTALTLVWDNPKARERPRVGDTVEVDGFVIVVEVVNVDVNFIWGHALGNSDVAKSVRFENLERIPGRTQRWRHKTKS